MKYQMNLLLVGGYNGFGYLEADSIWNSGRYITDSRQPHDIGLTAWRYSNRKADIFGA